MKSFMVIALLGNISAFASPLHLKCTSQVPTKKYLQVFYLADAHLVEQSESYLFDKDAHQYDPAIKINGKIEIDLHNGCDNLFKLSLDEIQFNRSLAGEKTEISASLEYSFPYIGESDADIDLYPNDEGVLNSVVCVPAKLPVE